MARINTTKMLSNDGYFSSNDYNPDLSNQTMTVSPLVSDLYDYAMTDDIILLHERKDTEEILYNIWINSPYAKQYEVNSSTFVIPKIPKEETSKIFYYMKNKLAEVKTLSAYEMVIAINEFFNFNYDYVVKKVLSPKLKAEILADYYNNGMRERMDANASVKLF